MRHVCAWCGREYGVSGDETAPNHITHGICAECEDYFQRDEPESLRRFLNRFDAPVLLVDDDAQVRTANDAACRLLETDPAEIGDLMFGEMVQCGWSRLPGGCGRTEHCAACAIRLIVGETLAMETDIVDRRALVDRFDDEGHVRRSHFLVSTERHGDTILLRIRDTE
jgi:PAS domain-containing protein